jgi:hypothetical protein
MVDIDSGANGNRCRAHYTQRKPIDESWCIFWAKKNSTRMTLIWRMFADLIRANPHHPRHPRAMQI